MHEELHSHKTARNETLCDPIWGRNLWFAASPPVVCAVLPLQRTGYLMRSLRDQFDRCLKLMALPQCGSVARAL